MVRAERPQRSRSKVGYNDYDAVPRSLRRLVEEHSKLPPPPADMDPKQRRLIMNDRLRPLDIFVLMDLLKYRRMTCSCWRAKSRAALDLGQSERTIQYSWRRLELYGFIQQIKVPNPDPDDPFNETGYRFTLLFAEGAEKVEACIDRRPPRERKGTSPLQPVASPPHVCLQPVASHPMHSVASKQRAGVSNSSEEKGELEKTPSSSSARQDDDELSVSLSGEGVTGDQFEEVTEAARDCYPDQAERIHRHARRLGPKIGHRWDCYAAAVYATKNRRRRPDDLLGYLRTVALDFAKNGISPEAEDATARIRRGAKGDWLDDDFEWLKVDPKYIKACKEMEEQYEPKSIPPPPPPVIPLAERIAAKEAERDAAKTIAATTTNEMTRRLQTAVVAKIERELAELRPEPAAEWPGPEPERNTNPEPAEGLKQPQWSIPTAPRKMTDGELNDRKRTIQAQLKARAAAAKGEADA